MLYHDRVGIVCIAIPKSGCTAAKRWYVSATAPDIDMQHVPIHKYAIEHLSLCDRPPEVVRNLLEIVPVLAFVRDPLERLRSAFVEKIVRPRPTDMFAPSRELLEQWVSSRGHEVRHDTSHAANIGGEVVQFAASTSVDYERGLTFREFVEYVTATPEHVLDPHWRPQAAFMRMRNADYVLPMSAIGDVLDALGSRLGVHFSAAERTNVTRKEPVGRGSLADVPSGELHRKDLRPPTSELADDSVRRVVSERLAEDMALSQRADQTDVSAAAEGLWTRRIHGPNHL